MTNYPIDEALEAMECDFVIILENMETGSNVKAPVFAENTMEQLVQEYASKIGLNAKAGRFKFMNKRTGEEASAGLSTSVAQLGLQNGDVLSICDDGCVAAAG